MVEQGHTPGNLEDAGNLVGVIGQFDVQDQSGELRLPDLPDNLMDENEDLRMNGG